MPTCENAANRRAEGVRLCAQLLAKCQAFLKKAKGAAMTTTTSGIRWSGFGTEPEPSRAARSAREVPAHTVVRAPVRDEFGQFAPGSNLGRRYDPHPDDEAFWRFLVGRRGVCDSTAYNYLRSIRRLERWSGVSRQELSIDQLDRFMSSPAWSWKTKNITLSAYRIYHRWGARRGLWEFQFEIDELMLRKKRHIIQPALTITQADTLLQVAHTPMDQRLVYVGLYTGLRLAEIAALDRSSWSPDDNGGVLRVIVKGGNERELPVHPELAPRLEHILSVPGDRKRVQRAAIRMRRHIEEPGFSTHWLRRTFGQALSECGVERDVIGALLGHSPSGVTVSNYVPVRHKELREALGRLHYADYQPTLFSPEEEAKWQS